MPVVVGEDGVGTAGPIVVTPEDVGQGFNSLYIPSARRFIPDPTDHGRTAETIFVRGYKERINVTVSAGATWTWRRTVFTFKGPTIRDYWLDNNQPPQYDGLGDSAGATPARTIGPMIGQISTQIRSLLYRGAEGVDWYDPFTASINTTRVSLISDKIITINPGNESGRTRTYRFWTPINKNLAYSSWENDQSEISSPYSVSSKPGVGDIYVFDQVRRETPASSAALPAQLRFSPEGVFYWHER